MTFLQYAQLLKFLFTEELERMEEFFSAVKKEEGNTEEKYWLAEPNSFYIPSKDELELSLKGWDLDESISRLKAGNEDVYLALRDLVCH